MNKLLLDSQIFDFQIFGGISRYYTEVFSELKTNKNLAISIPLCYTNNEYLKLSKLYEKKQNRFSIVINLLNKAGISTRKLIKKWNRNKTITALKKQNFDVFIPTYYDTYFLKHLGNKPFVLTVYDMINEIFPDFFSNGSETISNKLLLMEKATKIIAVSENTKKDIIRIYPHIDKKKIQVIYHGNSIKINESKLINLPEEYLLFVGVRDGYKNFNFLVESISETLKVNEKLKLVCAGGGKFKNEELQFISQLNLDDQIIQKNFSEDQLGLFYKNALCFIFPSMYEGFGIPVLESMACGCPIILTNNSSFPEVAGEAGIYYELNNKIDLRDKIESIIYDKELRNKYSLKGKLQVERFNWKDASKKCLDLYIDAKNE